MIFTPSILSVFINSMRLFKRLTVASGFANEPRSCPNVALATAQPSPLFPTIFDAGIFTSVKNTSLNPAFKVISTRGLISIPGVSIGINK